MDRMPKDLPICRQLTNQFDKVKKQFMCSYQQTRPACSQESIIINGTSTFNGSKESNDSGFLSKYSSMQDRLNGNSEFEHCGDTYLSIKMNSKKEMILEVTSLKINVTLSSRSKIPTIMIELTSKPSTKKFNKKTEVEVLRAVDGMICLNATFKSPIDSILDVNSLTLTFFKTTKHSFCELGFVEIPSSKILPSINNGTDTLIDGWFEIYKFVDNHNSNKTTNENKENESRSNRETRKRKSVTREPIYESMTYDHRVNHCDQRDNIIEYEMERKEKSSYGFTVLPHSKPARVKKINQNGSAFEAGIRVGDEIISVNGSKVIDLDASDVCKKIKETRPHQKLKLVIRRQTSALEYSCNNSTDYSCLYLSHASMTTCGPYTGHKCISDYEVYRSRIPVGENATFTQSIAEDQIHENFRSKIIDDSHHQQPHENSLKQSTKRRRVKVWKLKSFLHSRHSNNPGDIYQYIDLDIMGTEPHKWNPDISRINNEYQDTLPFPHLRRRLFDPISTSTCSDLNEAKLYNQSSMPEGLNDTMVYENPDQLRMNEVISSDISFDTSSRDEIRVANATFDVAKSKPSLLEKQEKQKFHALITKVEKEFLKCCHHCQQHYIDPLRNGLSGREFYKLFQNYEELIDASKQNLEKIYSIDTAEAKNDFLYDLSYQIDTLYSSYVHGCDESFKFLEDLFVRDEFRLFLEKYDNDVKPISSCLLLPLLHVMNIAESIEVLYGECEALDNVAELVEQCNDVIERVSQYWNQVVERTRSMLT